MFCSHSWWRFRRLFWRSTRTRRPPMRVRLRLMQALRRIVLHRVIQRRRNIRQPPATPARKDIRRRVVIRRPWGMRIPVPATAPRRRDIAPRPPDMERPRPGMVQRRPDTAPPLRDTERRRPGMARRLQDMARPQRMELLRAGTGQRRLGMAMPPAGTRTPTRLQEDRFR